MVILYYFLGTLSSINSKIIEFISKISELYLFDFTMSKETCIMKKNRGFCPQRLTLNIARQKHEEKKNEFIKIY